MVSGPTKKPLLDRLLAEQLIDAQQYQAVWADVEHHGSRVEDVLIDMGVLDEIELLKWLSSLFKTRFVSTEKLAKAEIERATLQLIPKRVAEKLLVFPVLLDPRDNSLAFVLADPELPELSHHVKLACHLPVVKAFVARPAAIRAAIQKHYYGDIHAFSRLDKRAAAEQQHMLETYERNVFAEAPVTSSSAALARGETLIMETPPEHAPQPASFGNPAAFGNPSTRQLRALDAASRASKSGTHTAAALSPMPQPAANTQRRLTLEGTAYSSPIELVNVLVSLLENQRQELRGHSAQVSRLMQRVGQHMGLDAPDLFALRLCGLLHDVGKTSSYHLTALNVAEYEGHRVQAKKSFLSPVRLFDAAGLPKACVEGLSSVYERFDGQGFPDRRAGKDIPMVARLLAIAETYADLTSNARNPFRRTLSAKATVEVLGRYKDKIFDPNLVDLFRVAALGEEMQSKLLNDRPRILLVDSDAEETTVLELRLVEQGHEVVLCRTAEAAFKRFQEGGIDAVITEVELPPHDGFTLVEHLRRQRGGEELPVLFLTRRADRASVDRGFALAAIDYIIKPASPDVVVAKVRNVLSKVEKQRGMRGVSGSLKEMPLPDVLQVLSRTRQSGLLRVRAGGAEGEIHFGNGDVYNAVFRGMAGENALYSMLALSDGEFALDPTFTPRARQIHETTERLLLEGMRRMDESGISLEAHADFSQTRADEI